MNPRRFFLAKAIGSIVVAVSIGGFFVLNEYLYDEKQGDDTVVEPYRASLEGRYVCLPYKESIDDSVESECEPGIRTDTDEYYAVNFYLMSQMHAPLEGGQRFSAKGVVTPIERLSTDEWQKFEVKGIFSVTDSLTLLGSEGESYACTAEAKLCPDGTYVGRMGPQCEFVPCPSSDNAPNEVTVSLGEEVTAMDVTISPQKVVSDSRCPGDITCVWAGTVEVRTTLATQVAHGEHVLTIGEPQVFGEYLVTLVAVVPSKTQEPISEDLYELTYLIRLK